MTDFGIRSGSGVLQADRNVHLPICRLAGWLLFRQVTPQLDVFHGSPERLSIKRPVNRTICPLVPLEAAKSGDIPPSRLAGSWGSHTLVQCCTRVISPYIPPRPSFP